MVKKSTAKADQLRQMREKWFDEHTTNARQHGKQSGKALGRDGSESNSGRRGKRTSHKPAQ